jgi:hypothetical protein
MLDYLIFRGAKTAVAIWYSKQITCSLPSTVQASHVGIAFIFPLSYILYNAVKNIKHKNESENVK